MLYDEGTRFISQLPGRTEACLDTRGRGEQHRKTQCMFLESLRCLQSMGLSSGLCLSKPQNIYRVSQASSCLPPISTAVCYRYLRVEIKSQPLGPNPWLRTIAQIDSDCFPSVSERRKQPTSGQGNTSVMGRDALGLLVMGPGLGTVEPLALGKCQGESCQPSVLLNLLSKRREEEVNVFFCLGALVASLGLKSKR